MTLQGLCGIIGGLILNGVFSVSKIQTFLLLNCFIINSYFPYANPLIDLKKTSSSTLYFASIIPSLYKAISERKYSSEQG